MRSTPYAPPDLKVDRLTAINSFDHINSLCLVLIGESDSSRRIKTEFLVQMDGVGHNQTGVLVLGATNVPWELDPAMRRRFDKRVYIALPEASARKSMFRLNLGDTPNTVTDEEFHAIATRAEGYSGSDIAIVVKEALMEPLRKCQSARQFYSTNKGLLLPCEDYPNCPYCPMALSTSDPNTYMKIPCKRCGAVRVSLYDIPTEKLQVPPVIYSDFEKALSRAHSSVAQSELQRFVKWTEEFGEEG
jgi:vacuolar protein-sorting-associated protein 4